MHHHETLPLGEFAIGTDTHRLTAWLPGSIGIAEKLPILIAEKMGPHFAVGDTCYSWSRGYQRSTTPTERKSSRVTTPGIHPAERKIASRAYFRCHTDITLPVRGARGSIAVVRADGGRDSGHCGRQVRRCRARRRSMNHWMKQENHSRKHLTRGSIVS